MIEQEFGPRRCKDTRKPSLAECPDAKFYHCHSCDSFYEQISIDVKAKELICCNEKTECLNPIHVQDLPPDISIDYKIVGGYNDNSVQVSWKIKNNSDRPRWIFLKTFTGGYMKYVSNNKRPPMVFALADMDAFAYCDQNPCLECTFRCKRGFIIYVYIETIGLVEIPLDKMSPYWQS